MAHANVKRLLTCLFPSAPCQSQPTACPLDTPTCPCPPTVPAHAYLPLPHVSPPETTSIPRSVTACLLASVFTFFCPPLPPLASLSPDYIASCCNEAGMRRQALGGKVPKTWLVRGVLRWGLLGGKVPKTWLVRGVLISRGGGASMARSPTTGQ